MSCEDEHETELVGAAAAATAINQLVDRSQLVVDAD